MNQTFTDSEAINNFQFAKVINVRSMEISTKHFQFRAIRDKKKVQTKFLHLLLIEIKFLFSRKFLTLIVELKRNCYMNS